MGKDLKELSKWITLVENEPEKYREYIRSLEKKDVPVIGITGPAGSGKSTLLNAMISHLRREDKKVGVVAVDPSSPFTGGAFLGDRIRMKKHFTDDGVFIRSMGSRGALGGLNDAVFDVVELMKGYDFDTIFVETVGAGQTEIEIIYLATTVVLVMSPGGGDEIQMLKAGITEIADIFVVNKADIDGADRLYLSIKAMLEISKKDGWIPPIIKTEAISGKGVAELIGSIYEHERYLKESGEMNQRKKRSVKKHAEHILKNKLLKILERTECDNVDALIEEVTKKFCKEV